MKLLLHIGAGKTGSTAVQDFLSLNRSLLLDEGVYLLGHPSTGDNRALAACCMGKYDFNGFFYYNGVAAEERESYRTEYFRSLLLELNALDSSIHTVVTSSEDFYSGLLRIDDIERLAAVVKPVFQEIEVLIYLRPQLEVLDSLYSTFLKNGQPLSYREFLELYFSPESVVYDFDKGLSQWESVFGFENINVHLFGAQEFVNGGLFDDFMHVLLPDRSVKVVRPSHRLNESLSPHGQKLMLAINKRLEAFSETKGWNPTWKAAVEYTSRKYTGKGIASRVPIERSAIVQMAASNDRVRLRYFPDRDTLFSRPIS